MDCVWVYTSRMYLTHEKNIYHIISKCITKTDTENTYTEKSIIEIYSSGSCWQQAKIGSNKGLASSVTS